LVSEETVTVMGIILKQTYIKAPPEVVFDLLTNPKKLARWMGTLSDRKLPRKRWHRTKEKFAIQSAQAKQFLRSKVVFLWDVNVMGKSVRSIVEIELERRGNGTCVRLTHKECRKRPVGTSGKRVAQTGADSHEEAVAQPARGLRWQVATNEQAGETGKG
jgi:uncharacterized protein YndB with AHSA1/START domain